MTRIVLIGGTGHVGTYLAPRLVAAGYEVINVSRSRRRPYQGHGAWRHIRQETIDRAAAEEAGTFGNQVAALEPDIVIDMICFTRPSAAQLVEALRGRIQHFLHCGTIWIHGPSAVTPTTEAQPRRPFGDYGIQKAEIETYLLDQARRHAFPATLLHPGHIVGPGWVPINPAGNRVPAVFEKLARGQEILLPNFGLETLHHVHADDVAQAFMQALFSRVNALGESFHVVSPAALTLRGYAEAVAGWYGQEANLAFLPWAEWEARHTAGESQATRDHIAHSPNCSIDKARRLLGYAPRYSSLEAIYEAVQWLAEAGDLDVPHHAIHSG